MRFGEIENLYARRGEAGPNLCFAGHTDVVPVGDAARRLDPAARSRRAIVRRGALIGRGAVDMKGAIAAFVRRRRAWRRPKGSLSLLITGDEEGDAVDGTVQAWSRRCGPRASGSTTACWASRPRRPLGDQIKIGRRGSLNAWITVDGKQGHVAYPAPGGQSDRPPDPPAGAAAVACAGRGLSALSAVQPGGHHHRRGQSGDQCDPGQARRG
jgi:succinyl-diaminopimelate desuccinylase